METPPARALPLGGGARCYVTAEHRFGIDAVLLAAFAAPRAQRMRCADLMSGCGIVSLLWCRDVPRLAADAFELQPAAAALARRAAAENGFSNLRVFTGDIRAIPRDVWGTYGLAACNPPFRAVGAGRQSSGDARETARGETGCTLAETVRTAARLLRGGGRFCLCMRPERLPETFALLRAHGLEPKRLRFAQRSAQTPPWLALAEARQGARPGLACAPAFLCEDENGGKSRDWRALFAPLEADALQTD